MSNTSYPKGMEKLLSGQIDVTSVTLAAALLPSTYTYSTSHEFLSQVGSRIGTDQDLTGLTIANGAIDFDDVEFGIIAPGSTIKAVVVYVKTGNPSTSRLLFYYDTVTGLPLATNGGDITIPWDDSTKKVAQLNAPFYPLGAEKVWSGEIDFTSNTIKAALLSENYVYDDEHEFLEDVKDEIIGTAVALGGISVTNGVLDANDVDFGNVTSMHKVAAILLYREGASDATSPLLMCITDGAGLPFSPNGSGLKAEWSNGANRIINLLPA